MIFSIVPPSFFFEKSTQDEQTTQPIQTSRDVRRGVGGSPPTRRETRKVGGGLMFDRKGQNGWGRFAKGSRGRAQAGRRLQIEPLEGRALMTASLAPIPSATVEATAGYQVPLNGSYGGNTDPQTYTVTTCPAGRAGNSGATGGFTPCSGWATRSPASTAAARTRGGGWRTGPSPARRSLAHDWAASAGRLT